MCDVKRKVGYDIVPCSILECHAVNHEAKQSWPALHIFAQAAKSLCMKKKKTLYIAALSFEYNVDKTRYLTKK